MYFVNNTGSCSHKIKVVFSFQTLLNDFKMEQSQKTASETKAKSYGCLRFIEQRGVIELKLLKSISQITVFGTVCRV